MTNELEKQFFDTFGIEERCILERYCDDCTNCACYHYPRITPEILLELICIAMDITDFGASNVKDLKEIVLRIFIDSCNKNEIEKLKNKIQNLFKES